MTEVQIAADGAGELLERDYWAVLRDPRVDPKGLIEILVRHFEDFVPPSIVRFQRPGPPDDDGAADGSRDGCTSRDAPAPAPPLEVGDELEVNIRGAGDFRVRVVHRNTLSMTLATVKGHPEAGRITFGSYHNARGDVVFHIRSRARAASRQHLAGFLFAGDPMQTSTWSGFVNRVASSVGEGVVGVVHAEKRRVDEEPGDRTADAPTYIAETA